MLFTIKACGQVSASSTIAADEKYSQVKIILHCPGHGSQPGREDYFFLQMRDLK